MTTIAISEEQWKELNNMRNLGETFSEVIEKLIENKSEEKFLNIDSENLN